MLLCVRAKVSFMPFMGLSAQSWFFVWVFFCATTWLAKTKFSKVFMCAKVSFSGITYSMATS